MTTSLNAQNEKLVIAVSSRALFDLEEEHRLFERRGSQPTGPTRWSIRMCL